jgi:hypothetical protein
MEIMMTEKFFPASQVWAAAAAAQRINGEYVKRSIVSTFLRSPIKTQSSKLTNVAIMRILLNGDQTDITSDDYAQGKAIREDYGAMIRFVFSDDANNFVKAAVKVASLENIDINGGDLPLIASLPESHKTHNERMEQRRHLDDLISNSVPLSCKGKRISNSCC